SRNSCRSAGSRIRVAAGPRSGRPYAPSCRAVRVRFRRVPFTFVAAHASAACWSRSLARVRFLANFGPSAPRADSACTRSRNALRRQPIDGNVAATGSVAHPAAGSVVEVVVDTAPVVEVVDAGAGGHVVAVVDVGGHIVVEVVGLRVVVGIVLGARLVVLGLVDVGVDSVRPRNPPIAGALLPTVICVLTRSVGRWITSGASAGSSHAT